MKQYFVTATHTDAGKTFVSSLLVSALDAYYWKPIQAGEEIKDADYIREHARISSDKILPEAYLLKSPESPHSAAKKEGVEIDLEQIILPKVSGNLIVEGAGGVLVPVNDTETILDVVAKLGIEIILVVPTYLGCINHSLLTIEAIKSRGLEIKGVIFNGEESLEAQQYILKKAGNVISCRIPKINPEKKEDFEAVILELSQLFN